MCKIMHLSAPLKFRYAKLKGICFHKLLDSSEFKEKYRKEMIFYGQLLRISDPHIFCKDAIEKNYEVMENLHLNHSEKTISNTSFPIWIISDVRYKSDLKFFTEKILLRKSIKVLIKAGSASRLKRGWIFTPGVDDNRSECDLDSIKDWDVKVDNDDDKSLNEGLDRLFNVIDKMLIQNI
ncbi:unnamed protein product [Gordionus sp. m RMFG-2023]